MTRFLMILTAVALLGFAPNASAHRKTYHVKKYHHHHKGLKRSPHIKEFLSALPKHQPHFEATEVPASMDLTALVSPPEDQGSCGSCWDFALTKALRSALMLNGKDPGVLAFNYLLDNCGPGPAQYGCGGGDFDAGGSFLAGAGPWLESQDPYREVETRCKTGLAVAGTALKQTQVGGTKPSFEEIASAVSEKHMLVIDVAACGDWMNYSDGIFNTNQCDANSIDHMINLVGYDCETSKDAAGNCVFDSKGQPANGDGFLKVMNNWGTSWGESGYMRTRWGVDAVADTAMYFEVAALPPGPVPIPPQPPTPPREVPNAAWIVVGALFLATGGILLIKALASKAARQAA